MKRILVFLVLIVVVLTAISLAPAKAQAGQCDPTSTKLLKTIFESSAASGGAKVSFTAMVFMAVEDSNDILVAVDGCGVLVNADIPLDPSIDTTLPVLVTGLVGKGQANVTFEANVGQFPFIDSATIVQAPPATPTPEPSAAPTL